MPGRLAGIGQQLADERFDRFTQVTQFPFPGHLSSVVPSAGYGAGKRCHFERADERPYAENGRGLLVVEALSSRWGFRRIRPCLKVVWAELLISQGRAPASRNLSGRAETAIPR